MMLRKNIEYQLCLNLIVVEGAFFHFAKSALNLFRVCIQLISTRWIRTVLKNTLFFFLSEASTRFFLSLWFNVNRKIWISGDVSISFIDFPVSADAASHTFSCFGSHTVRLSLALTPMRCSTFFKGSPAERQEIWGRFKIQVKSRRVCWLNISDFMRKLRKFPGRENWTNF